MFTAGLSRASKFPSRKRGTVVDNEWNTHSVSAEYDLPICSVPRTEPLPLQNNIGGTPVVPECLNIIFINSTWASRCFHLPTASETPLPSDKFAASTDTGYHATYPIPRTAVKVVPIWSQSEFLAVSAGTPMRVNRVASCGITPSYPISSSTTCLGATGLGRVTIASDNAPV